MRPCQYVCFFFALFLYFMLSLIASLVSVYPNLHLCPIPLPHSFAFPRRPPLRHYHLPFLVCFWPSQTADPHS